MRHVTGVFSASLALFAVACGPVEAPPPTAPVSASDHSIIDGAPARADEMRSTLALVDPGSGAFFCTGTLVAPTVVVTAAHCLMTEDQSRFIQADDAQVGVAVLDARAVPANKRIDIARFAIHPGFAQSPLSDDPSGLGKDDDIAVLVLAQPVRDLPTTEILPAARLDDIDGAALVISGYGVNDLRSDAAGVLHIGQTSVVRRTGHEVLAGGGGDADTCFGDSGGPAYLEAGGQRFLVGATSRGAMDAPVDCGDRGIYTLVPAYRDWIDEVVAGGPAADAPPPELGGGGDWGDEDWGDEWDDEAWDEEWEDDGEPDADVCAEEGFYGDDICDPWCDRHDIDCGPADQPAEQDPHDAPDAQPEPDEPEAQPEPAAEPEPEPGAEPDGAYDPNSEREDTPVEPVDDDPEAEQPDDTPLIADAPAAEQEAPADGGGCDASGGGGANGGGWMLLWGLLFLTRRRRVTVTS